MSNLMRVDRLGDINFGLPEDLAPHKKPWEYYKILGIERTATREEIRRAFGESSKKTHPDTFREETTEWKRATERQKLIGTIRDVLCDDENELGERFSKRHQYDEVSRYGEFFGGTHIQHKGERTQTMAEELFILFELEKRQTEAEHRFKEQNPEIAEYIKKLDQAVEKGDMKKAATYAKKAAEGFAEKEGIPLDEFLRRREAAKTEAEKRRGEHKKECEKLEEGITAAREIAASEKPESRKKPKVFELWYNGKKDGEDRRVTFETGSESNFSYVGGHETKAIIKLGLVKAAVLSLMRQVHFKAQYADVEIKDAYLKGVIQIVNGSVTINYEGSSYGTVIRARAPQVTASNDFVNKGDLYIPKAFAEAKDWEKRTPDIDIAVLKGNIDIRMQRRAVQETGSYYDYGHSAFENILGGSIEKRIRNDPNKTDYIINKIYTKNNYNI